MLVKCQNCQKDFNRKPSAIKSKVYCSMNCRDEDNYQNKFIEGLTEKDYIEQNYIVEPEGFLINRRTGKKVGFTLTHKGYLKARIHTPLSKNPDGRKPYYLHRIIAMFYLSDYTNELQVNHKNGIKTDNRVDNLEMVDGSQNVYHAWNNLNSSVRKEKLNKRRNEKGRFE
jgi:hypothetical protein